MKTYRTILLSFVLLSLCLSCSKNSNNLDIESYNIYLFIEINEAFPVKIITGSGNYKYSIEDENIASIEIKDESLFITPKKEGKTLLYVTDVNFESNKLITINVINTISQRIWDFVDNELNIQTNTMDIYELIKQDIIDNWYLGNKNETISFGKNVFAVLSSNGQAKVIGKYNYDGQTQTVILNKENSTLSYHLDFTVEKNGNYFYGKFSCDLTDYYKEIYPKVNKVVINCTCKSMISNL